MVEIELRPTDEHSRSLWASVAELTDVLPAEWVLVGGLMVQLHAVEAGIEAVRVTRDVDVLGQSVHPARWRPSTRHWTAMDSRCSSRPTAWFAATYGTT
jgi:hypothetical protein